MKIKFVNNVILPVLPAQLLEYALDASRAIDYRMANVIVYWQTMKDITQTKTETFYLALVCAMTVSTIQQTAHIVRMDTSLINLTKSV